MELGRIDLNLLIALDALLSERNVSRAAKRLGITQSATSVQLRRLRGVFDDELLVRVGREYHPTPLAEHLIEPLTETLRSIEQMVAYRPDFEPHRERRVFRIGTNDALEYLVIKPFLEEIQHSAPGIAVEVYPYAGAQTFDMIETGILDLGIHQISAFESHFEEEYLFTAPWIGVASADNDAVGESLTWEQFQASPNAIYNWAWHDRSRYTLHDYDFFEDAPWRLADNSHFLRLFMLQGTDVVTLTYEHLARAVCQQASLKLISLEFDVEPARFGLHWHPRSATDPAHAWLRTQLVQATSRLERLNRE
jgi:DNA-binding transcriptional LysR family regulator